MYQFKLFVKFISLVLLLSNQVARAEVSMSVDRTDISAGETFVLDIRVNGDTDAQPDLSLIPKEFTIISNSQYHHSQFVNGQQTTLKGWKLKLKTLSKGPITIPSITVGNEKTQPIRLIIKDSSNQLDMNGQSKLIFLEASTQQKEAYVQEQIILNVSLYRAVNIHYARLSEPSANNSIVEKLGDDIQFEKQIDNRRYIVTQRKYAIFPQESGELTITPVNFSADVNDSSRRNRNSFLSSTRPISLSTEAIKLNIKPKPQNAPANWLPATDVVLVDQWTPNTRTLKVGEPATWTLLLSIDGLSESQLPELKIPPVDGLQWYYDSPQKERQITDKGIKGQRVEKLAVIPSKAGEITIPEIKLDWWDVKSDSLKTATLPSKILVVEVATTTTQSPQISVPQPLNVDSTHTSKTNVTSSNWMYLSFALLLLWLATLIAYYRKSENDNPSMTSINPAGPQTSESARRSLKHLLAALKANDLSAIELHLLRWLRSCGHPTINSLEILSKQLKSPELIKKTKALDAMRYSALQQEACDVFSKSDLDSILSEIASPNEIQAQDAIPPLYRR